MQIQVNSDNHIQADERLIEYTRDVITGALSRFQDRVTRVEAHLTDENGANKSAADDKRCALEARLAGMQPVAVTHRAATVREALSGAVDKLEKMLDSKLEKEHDKRRA